MKKYFIRTINIKKLILPVLSILFILCLVFFSKTAVNSALKGLNLWFNVVFPSLFPFFVASELLYGTGFEKAMGRLLEPVMRPLFNVPGRGSFAFLMGITSGYPVGAKITASMRKEGMITKDEAERLLAFTNNSGPLFVVGAVAVGMFKRPQLGLFLLMCHVAACITVGVLMAIKSRRIPKAGGVKTPLISHFKGKTVKFKGLAGDKPGYIKSDISRAFQNTGKGNNVTGGKINKPEIEGRDLGSALGDAVRNSIATILAIGGFIILFSVIINLLLETGLIGLISEPVTFLLEPLGIGKDIIISALCGFFEITVGTNLAASTVEASIMQKLAAASFIIGWAGLSVHSQVLSIVSETDISLKYYIYGKFLQGVIAATYTVIGLKMAGHLFPLTETVFSHSYASGYTNWQDNLLFSAICLFALLLFMLLLYLAACLVNPASRRTRPGRKKA